MFDLPGSGLNGAMADPAIAAPLLRLAGVSLRFGAVAALEAVDLEIGEREVVTLIGPNGAGKTTLLRVALGLAAPDAGTVTRRPGIRIGYMPQRVVIEETLPLTVRRFLALGGRVPKGRRRAVFDETAVRYLLDQPIQRVSGGELQRVLLARALLREPELLVLDEPAQNLDLPGQADFYRLIAEVRERRRCGVLVVSHDLHMVMGAADRVVCLNRHVCCTGRPQDVRAHPEYRALFPSADEIAGLALYTHSHDHAHAPSGDVLPLADAGEGEAVPPRHG